MKVKLPIFFNSEENALLEDLGITPKQDDDEDEFKNAVERILTFYSIDIIFPYNGEDKYTKIISGGETFICMLPLNKVEKLIDDANT